MGFFFTETYQAAKFIERDGEFQIEDDLETGEVDTVYITICTVLYICRLLSQKFIIHDCILFENNPSNK